MGGDSTSASIACPHAVECPGCPEIDRPLAEQLARKSDRLGRALALFPSLAGISASPVRAADRIVDYRTRAKVAVGPQGRIGLFAQGGRLESRPTRSEPKASEVRASAGHDVLDLPHCRVLAPVIADALGTLRAFVAKPPPETAPVLLPDGVRPGRLRALDLREVVDESGAGLLLTLVLRAPAPARVALDAACEALLASIPSLRAIALSLHDGRSPQLLGAPPTLLRGAPLLRDFVRPGAPYALVAPGSFAQAHRAQAAAIHDEIERALAPLAGRRVLELFSGNGALGLALSARGAAVTLVESFEQAAAAAARAAREQGLAERVRVVAKSAEVASAEAIAARERFSAAIANPPRRGLAPRLREALAWLAKDAIVYVSCEPATLARDLAHLADLGWRAGALTPFDMMPLTTEVECLALLSRAAPPALGVLDEDADLVAVAKPPFLPTVPHPERRGSLLERVRALPDCEHAVPLHRLDVDTSGVCLFARRAELAAPWQRALTAATATKRYVALVRGFAREKGHITRPLREQGRERTASTRYRRTEIVRGHALLEVTIESGRTHQIRRHLAAIGEPVLGDERHGHAPSNRHLFERFFLDRPFLHCASIELARPARSGPLRIEAPLAPDLAAVLERLRA